MKRYKWTVEIEVADTWVADGLDLTENRLHDALTRAFPYVRMSEIAVNVIEKPSDEDLAAEMGYPSAAVYARSVRWFISSSLTLALSRITAIDGSLVTP